MAVNPIVGYLYKGSDLTMNCKGSSRFQKYISRDNFLLLLFRLLFYEFAVVLSRLFKQSLNYKIFGMTISNKWIICSFILVSKETFRNLK